MSDETQTQNESNDEANEVTQDEANEKVLVEPDFSKLSQVAREALDRGDNPRSLSPDQYALYILAVADANVGE